MEPEIHRLVKKAVKGIKKLLKSCFSIIMKKSIERLIFMYIMKQMHWM